MSLENKDLAVDYSLVPELNIINQTLLTQPQVN